MTQIELSPEVEARLAAEAQARDMEASSQKLVFDFLNTNY
jgi:hypothetical protein